MDVEITSKRENTLLGRIEVRAVVKHANSPTPRREEVREAVSRSLGGTKEGVVVESMKSVFGKHETLVFAKVYSRKEDALKLERHHILVRNKLAEKKQAAQKAVKAPKQQAK
jgi:small subunit ribosomal protein S24e